MPLSLCSSATLLYVVFVSVLTHLPGSTTAQQWNNVIYVSTTNGTNDTSCLTLGRDIPCASLDVALQALTDSTVIYLYPGNYGMHSMIEIIEKTDIAVFGLPADDASEVPTVYCGDNAMLLFYNSTNITLQSLRIQDCGDIVIDDTSGNNANEDKIDIRVYDSKNVILRDLILESTIKGIKPMQEDCYSTIMDCLSLHSADSGNQIAVSGQPVYTTVYVVDSCTSSITLWKNDLIACLDNSTDQGIASFNPLNYQQCSNLSYDGSVQTPGYPFIVYQISNSSTSSVNVSVIITSQWELVDNLLQYTITVDSCSFPFVINELQHKCVFKLNDWFCCDSSSSPGPAGSCNSCNMQSLYIRSNSSENCLSTDTATSLSSNYDKRFYFGYSQIYYDCGGCPSFVENCDKYSEFDPFNLSSISFCANGREGRLCGACEPGKGVPINQLNNCVDCTQYPVPGMIIFILIQLIPVTVMVLIIILFGINLNQGFIIAAVYYFQITGIVYPGLTFNMVESFCGEFTDYNLNACNYHEYYHYVLPNTVFNWNFVSFLMRYPLCISSRMTPLEAITFWYIIPMYPLLLMAVIYVWIRMYDKGYWPVVKVSRPVHYRIARFWRSIGIESSLFQSMASIYTLSFTQLAATSFQILHPTQWHLWNETTTTGIAFFNDGTVDYFGWPHAIYAIIAIIMLTVFVIIPMIFIQLYPFRFFQQFLSFCHLNKAALVSIMDVFTGPFKPRSDESFEYRYFAGLYFLLRLTVLVLHYIPYDKGPAILFTQEGLFLTFSGMIMIFRPYKRNIYNFGDFFVVVFLAFSNILMLYIRVEYTKITILAFSVMLYGILLSMYFIYPTITSIRGYMERRRQLKNLQLQQKASITTDDGLNQFIVVGNVINQAEGDIIHIPEIDFVEFPDRLENPKEYEAEHHIGRGNSITGRHIQQQHAPPPTSYKVSSSQNGNSSNSECSSKESTLQDKPLLRGVQKQ